jgi:hypothetical protein
MGGVTTVHALMANDSLGTFRRYATWHFSDGDGVITGSPTSAGSGAHARGLGGGLWLFEAGWIARSGIFY